jgi:DNA-binding PadR family transcriptional regulator
MRSKKRRVSNPLALAVMAQLLERPMHPYEIAAQMKERHLHEVIKLNYGSLYSVVEVLQREHLISPRETVREGRRPERTVYEITEAGHAEFLGWLRELLSTPAQEYQQLAAGLAFIASIPLEEAVALLEERAHLLEKEVEKARSEMDTTAKQGVPRLFLLESEYVLALREAELGWIRELVREIQDGTLEGAREWKAFHSDPNATDPSELAPAVRDTFLAWKAARFGPDPSGQGGGR